MRNLIVAISVTVLLFAAGCEKTPVTSGSDVPQAVLASFEQMYPGAENVQWSSRHSYWVASFGEYINLKNPAPMPASPKNSAWYDGTGKWYMTEFHSELSGLPDAVKSAFADSDYAAWRVDDIDVILRDGVEKVYVIEVEGSLDGRETEIDLYFSEDGVLVKERFDMDDSYDYWDYIPSRPASSLSDAVNSVLPGARILDVEEDDGAIEVEVVDADRISREIYFSLSLQWLLTKTEMWYGDLPEAVRSAFESSQYARYWIEDDIDYYQWSDGKEYYILEIDSREHDDLKVKIDKEGNLSVAAQDDIKLPYGGNKPVDGALTDFISGRYPGYILKEIDEDDGFIKAEIVHEGIEKDVYFNWSREWVWTEWDVRFSALPEPVIQTLAQYREVDDISYIETSSSSFYSVEVEIYDDDVTVRISPEGEVID